MTLSQVEAEEALLKHPIYLLLFGIAARPKSLRSILGTGLGWTAM